MKRIISLIAAAFFALAALGGIACSTNDTGRSTPSPSANPTADATRNSMLEPSASPSASPRVSASPEASPSPDMSAEPSASPGMDPGTSAGPNATPGAGDIPDFMEGRVIDPSEIPEIVSSLEREFPNHGIQAVTHEFLDGAQVYRVVLQGEGELSRVIFVYPSGSILLPAAAD